MQDLAEITHLRDSDLATLVNLLETQKGYKLDANVPLQALESHGGRIHVRGLRLFGGDTVLDPLPRLVGHLAEKLGIPAQYLRKIQEERTDIFDSNVNRWIHGTTGLYQPDERMGFIRSFTDPETGRGVGRALLSDRFAPVDNWDVLFAALDGVKESGVEVECVKADLSETRMNVRFACPAVGTLAPTLLEHYNPQVDGWGDLDAIRRIAQREGHGYTPGTEPVMFAGFDIRNGETGGGAREIVPVLTFSPCGNGLVLKHLAMRKIHVGAKLDEGIVRWSDATQQASLELVRLQTIDAVRSFLDVEFVREQVSIIEGKATKPVSDPIELVKVVAQECKYSDETAKGILDHFIKGGQFTSGGILNAVTSFAQTVEDADAAFDLEATALEALEVAYAEA
jgi:hypothetical protein